MPKTIGLFSGSAVAIASFMTYSANASPSAISPNTAEPRILEESGVLSHRSKSEQNAVLPHTFSA
ncbi:MAG: hypothetical protein AAF528_07930 [Cyanobacteria bacterium P01_C01_bin.121]